MGAAHPRSRAPTGPTRTASRSSATSCMSASTRAPASSARPSSRPPAPPTTRWRSARQRRREGGLRRPPLRGQGAAPRPEGTRHQGPHHAPAAQTHAGAAALEAGAQRLIAKRRAPVESVFSAMKRLYGKGRTRCHSLAANAVDFLAFPPSSTSAARRCSASRAGRLPQAPEPPHDPNHRPLGPHHHAPPHPPAPPNTPPQPPPAAPVASRRGILAERLERLEAGAWLPATTLVVVAERRPRRAAWMPRHSVEA